MYQRKNLGKVQNGAKAAPKESEIIILAAEDCAYFPPRDGSNVKLLGNFLINPGAAMYRINHSKSKFSAPLESEGDEDMINVKHTCEAIVPGSTLDIKEFIQNWIGVDCFVLHKSCQDDFYEVVGTPCAPLQLMPTKQDNNDGRFYTLKFESFAKTDLVPGNYYGVIVEADPADVADVTATAIDGDTNTHYLLPELSVTAAVDITSVANLDHGDYITLVGSGGSDPATLASGTGSVATIVLVSGTTWTALEGSVLQLQYFNAGGTEYFIEVNRE